MQCFIESIKDIKLQPGECVTSYDVTALFTSVPVDKALNIIHDKLLQYQGLKLRTTPTIQHIIELLWLCLQYIFSLSCQYYKQVEEVTMGCPVSVILANIYMEYFRVKH